MVPCASTMLPVPGPSFVTSMPLGCSLSGEFGRRVEFAHCDGPLSVDFGMGGIGEADEVVEVVVERVEVGVMDVVSGRDRPVCFDPEFFVETFDAALPVGFPWSPVAAIGPPFGVWVAPKFDSIVEGDFDSVGHGNRISPYRMASSDTHPRSTTQTGCSAVPTSDLPPSISTRSTG